jgi:hypothetical protein
VKLHSGAGQECGREQVGLDIVARFPLHVHNHSRPSPEVPGFYSVHEGCQVNVAPAISLAIHLRTKDV